MYTRQRKRKDGKVSFEVTYYLSGKSHTKTFRDKKSADLFKVSIQKKKLENSQIVQYSNQTLKEYYFQWIKYKETTTQINTAEDYKNSFKKLLPLLGHIKITKLSSGHIQDALIEIKKEIEERNRDGMSTMQHCYVALNTCLNQAVKEQKIQYNPCKSIKKPTVKSKKVPLSEEQLQLLLNYLNGKNNYKHLILPLSLGALCGLRREEIVGLKWSSVDLYNNTITINNAIVLTNSKGILEKEVKNTFSNRTIPLPPQLNKMLVKEASRINQLQNNVEGFKSSEYVCTNAQGKHMKPNYLTKTFKKIFRELEFSDNISLTSSRKSFASILANNSINLSVIKELMGHSDIRTTSNIYISSSSKSKINAIKILDSKISNTI